MTTVMEELKKGGKSFDVYVSAKKIDIFDQIHRRKKFECELCGKYDTPENLMEYGYGRTFHLECLKMGYPKNESLRQDIINWAVWRIEAREAAEKKRLEAIKLARATK